MAPQSNLSSSLSPDIPTLGSSAYGFASQASSTSPPVEDAADGGEVVGDDSIATRTVVLIVLGTAIFAFTILSLFLFSRAGTLAQRRTRSFPTASCPRSLARLSAQVPRLARAASQQVLAPALRNAPFYLPRPSNRPPTVAPPYSYGSAGSASGSFGPLAYTHTRTSFETNGSTAIWSDTVAGGAVAYAQPPPPYWTIGAPDAAIPARVCAVPAAIRA